MTTGPDKPRRHFKWSEVKWAKQQGGDAMERANAAYFAGRRLIAGGGRPAYSVAPTQADDRVRYVVLELPWIAGEAADVTDALTEARAQIADWMRVDANTFDVATE